MADGYSISAWFQLIGLAALVGAGGQATRTIVGIKKANDAASMQAAAGVEAGELIQLSRLLISLLIGAIAGAISAVMTIKPDTLPTAEHLAGIAAAGYAGADFIEGFITRTMPDPGAPAGQEAVGTGGAGTNPAADESDDAVG